MAVTPSDITVQEFPTPHCGTMKVFIQGDINERQGKTIFMTCHDMGTNHKSWYPFIMDHSMTEVRLRSIFLHVCVPGQEDRAEKLATEDLPTLTQMGDDFASILDQLHIKTVIAIGDGAGASIICRFSLQHPNRCFGIILVHCTSTTAGVMEYVKDKVINRRLLREGMNQTAWDYLITHKFGYQNVSNKAVEDYLTDLQESLNPHNVAKYLDSFLRRTDLSATLAQSLKCEALLVVGSRASHLHTVQTMHSAMSKSGSSILIVDDVGDVITEAPDKLARALILFCKGCGVLPSVGIPGIDRQKTLSGSMEEADKPYRTRGGFSPTRPS